MRYQAADESEIRSPRAFVATIVSRLCLDRLKSARSAREEYVGPWLPEPVLTSEMKGPDIALQHAEVAADDAGGRAEFVDGERKKFRVVVCRAVELWVVTDVRHRLSVTHGASLDPASSQ